MNSAQLWIIFRKFRIVIFAFHAILSLGWTIFLSLFLAREWIEYGVSQRAIVVGLTAFQGFATLLLYLMMVVQFRKWLDAARVAFILFSEASTIALFSILGPDFPCFQFGATYDMCRTAMKVIMIGIWSQSGLLFLYICALAAMSCFPEPGKDQPQEAKVTPYEVALSQSRRSSASSVNSRSGLLQQEHDRSVRAPSPQRDRLANLPNSRSPMRALPVARPPPLQAHRPDGYSYMKSHRPGTPSTISSASSSSTSSYGSRYGTPYTVDRSPNSSRSHRPLPAAPLPNPFADPLMRSPSAFSAASYGSSITNEGYEYVPRMRYDYGTMASPRYTSRNLEAHYRLGGAPKTPLYHSPVTTYSPGVQFGNLPSPYLQVPMSPLVVRAHEPRQTPPRYLTATPGSHSVHSLTASVHALERNGAASAPHIPSNPMYSPSALSPPPSALLPLPMGSRTYGDNHENMSSDRQYRLPVSPRRSPIDVPVDGAVDLKQWQKDVLGAARRS